MDKGRLYLVIGAGLVVLSMVLTAFSFNSSGSDSFYGAQVWYISVFIGIGDSMNGYIIFQAMMLCALFNIPQLLYPLAKSPRAGTSTFWVWTFTIMTFIILPALVVIFQIDEHNLIIREGYILYQAGYIFSAVGFWKKKKQLEATQAAEPTSEQISSYI